MSTSPSQTNPLLDKKLILAFVEGVKSTLEMMASTQIAAEKAYVETKYNSNAEVAGSIGMVADNMRGHITISFQKEAIFKVIENMLGEVHTEINQDVCDAVGELTNQIYGSAKTTLNELGYGFDMAIPTVIQGKMMIAGNHSQGATLIIPFLLQGTSLSFHIAITVNV